MIRSPWRGRSGDIGAWRTGCTGSWMSLSARTTAGCGTAPPRATSPCCARSPSTWWPRTAAAGPAYAAGARRPPGTTTTCSGSSSATLMREPWAVYADKAYDSEARRAGLRERGIEPRIMYQARRNRPLKPWQTWFNKAAAPVRAGVERVFGTMKRAYGHRRVRYLGLARNDVQLQALCVAINLRRALALGLA